MNGFAAAVRQRFGENHKVFGKFADVERRTTEAVGSRLSDHDKRALRLEEFLLQSLYCGVGESNIAVEHTEAALFGQFGCVEREERFGYGHVDERVIEELVDEEISIGDYVLTGGELPALTGCLIRYTWT